MKNKTFSGKTLRKAAAVGVGLAVSTSALGVMTAQAASITPSTCVTADSQSVQNFKCNFSGTLDSATETFPMTYSDGVVPPYGVYKLDTSNGGAPGTITFTTTSVTVTLDPDYVATHPQNLTFNGYYGLYVDSYNKKGPFSITINGVTTDVPNPGNYCDTACQLDAAKVSYKSAWVGQDNGVNKVISNAVLGSNDVVIGQEFVLKDYVDKYQTDCVGTLQVQNNTGGWDSLRLADTDYSGRQVTVTFTPTVQMAYRLNVSCTPDGTTTEYSDIATINGKEYTASAIMPIAGGSASGTPAPTPAPTTPPVTQIPTPTPTVTTPPPTTPPVVVTPTPTPTPSKTTPTTPPPAPVKYVTKSFQVDRYSWSKSAWFGNKILGLDDDGVLKYREDSFIWNSVAGRTYTKSAYQFVTVTLPTTATANQWISAINAKTNSTIGDVKYTTKAVNNAALNGSITMAWQLGAGALPKDGGMAWGSAHNVNQSFFARS